MAKNNDFGLKNEIKIKSGEEEHLLHPGGNFVSSSKSLSALQPGFQVCQDRLALIFVKPDDEIFS